MRETTGTDKAAPVTDKRESVTHITVRAHDAVDNEDGTFRLVLPTREVSPEELAVLARLFPHTEAIIGRAMAVEALMANVVVS